MSSGQVSGTHEELTRDLTTRESKRVLEELHPIRLVERMVHIEPRRKGTVLSLESQNHLCIVYGGVDLQAIPDDPRITQETRPVLLTIRGHTIDRESIVHVAKAISFLENSQPAQARLIDLQYKTLEQEVIIPYWKAVLSVVIRLMELVALRCMAEGVLGDLIHVWPMDRREAFVV